MSEFNMSPEDRGEPVDILAEDAKSSGFGQKLVDMPAHYQGSYRLTLSPESKDALNYLWEAGGGDEAANEKV